MQAARAPDPSGAGTAARQGAVQGGDQHGGTAAHRRGKRLADRLEGGSGPAAGGHRPGEARSDETQQPQAAAEAAQGAPGGCLGTDAGRGRPKAGSQPQGQ